VGQWKVGMMFACSLLALANAGAHAHGTHQLGEVDYLNCERPPQNAIGELPAPLATWARIECTQKGTKLVAAPGWTWRYPNSWFDRPIAPAWAPDASIAEPGAKYFIDFSVTVLEGQAAAEQHGRLAEAIPAYGNAFTDPPATIYRVLTENNLGHEMVLWFPAKADDDLWAILCTPDCRPDYAFIIQKPKP
jgi:hypothetical protein